MRDFTALTEELWMRDSGPASRITAD